MMTKAITGPECEVANVLKARAWSGIKTVRVINIICWNLAEILNINSWCVSNLLFKYWQNSISSVSNEKQ